MSRDILWSHLPDVAKGAQTEILFVYVREHWVRLAGKDADMPQRRNSLMEAAEASKKVDESQLCGCGGSCDTRSRKTLAIHQQATSLGQVPPSERPPPGTAVAISAGYL